MKIVAILFLAVIADVYAAPTQISDNNIGDIVNVYVNANLKVINKINEDMVNVIVGILNRQSIDVASGPSLTSPAA